MPKALAPPWWLSSSSDEINSHIEHRLQQEIHSFLLMLLRIASYLTDLSFDLLLQLLPGLFQQLLILSLLPTDLAGPLRLKLLYFEHRLVSGLFYL